MLPQAIIIDDQKVDTVSINAKRSYRSKITQKTKTVLINEVLPFRIRFTDVRIPGYGQNNVPGIGLQIIGYSNYIL